jgi:hypothetical protein
VMGCPHRGQGPVKFASSERPQLGQFIWDLILLMEFDAASAASAYITLFWAH